MFYDMIQPKYLECDPLPDPNDEKDLTTFIRMWKEQQPKIYKFCETRNCHPIVKNCAKHCVKHAVKHCQLAEDVIKKMLDIYGEALATYNG